MTSRISLDRRSLLGGAAALAGSLVLPTGTLRAAAGGTPVKGGTLRMSVDQAVSVLNPLQARVNPEYLVAELLYSGLTRLAPDMAAEPDLALEWSSSQDLTEWTFRLRPGITFHDGSPCTAEDVVASFEAILDERTASPGRRNIGPVEAVSAVDELTVLFRTSAPYADLPVALAYTNAKVVPAAIARGGLERLSREAIGTGPFRLVAFEPERIVVVERNPGYFVPERPHLDRVEVVVFPDPGAEGSALLAGDTDLMLTAQPTEFARFANAPGVVPLRTPSGQFLNINMDCRQKPFDDPRVRKALALAVDRRLMVDFVAEGYGTPGNDVPLSPAYRFHEELPLREASLDEARRLLAEAGHPDGLDITLVASDRPGSRTQLAVAVREMAKPAGFRIAVETMPHATYLEQVWKKGNFYVGFYNMQATADAIFSLLYTSDAAWNETRWNNAAFDRLVAEARTTIDEARRAELYGQAQALMHEEVPSVIPCFFDLLAGQRERVRGYVLHPRGAVFRLDHVWLADGAAGRG